MGKAFKTKWFAKAAAKVRVEDSELRKAIREVQNGQAVDLGGGVFKKRLDHNRQRSIILMKGSNRWFYVYLFAKQDRDNIDAAELKAFRSLADLYAAKSDADLKREVDMGELIEISLVDESNS